MVGWRLRLREGSGRGIEGLLLAIALSSILALALIALFIVWAGMPILITQGPLNFILGRHWIPSKGLFGILPMIVGSFWVTLGALLIGVPLGLACAIFLAEFAPGPLATIIRPAVQLLAGIPSVIYGFLGLTILVPWIREYLGGPGLSILASSIILGVMILPSVIAISEDAIRAVPREYRDGALALGVTQWQAIATVVLPAARSGILASIILGMGRAIGETMAVIMVVGNAAQIPRSLLDPARTLTSNIGIEMAYASGEHRQALFATGVVLLVVIMVLTATANLFGRRGGSLR